MKNRFYLGAALLATMALSACNNEAEEAATVEQQNAQEVTIYASMGADTRTTVSTSGTSGYLTNWSTDDKIFVWGYMNTTQKSITSFDPDVYGTLSYKEKVANGSDDSDNSKAKFNGLIYGNTRQPADKAYALYPKPLTMEGNDVAYFELKRTYEFAEPVDGVEGDYEGNSTDGYLQRSKSPMYWEGSSVEFGNSSTTPINMTFQHLCGMIRLILDPSLTYFSNITTEKQGEVTLTLISKKSEISGTAKFTIDENQTGDAKFNLEMENLETKPGEWKQVSFNIYDNVWNSSKPLYFDIPVPAYNELEVYAKLSYLINGSGGNNEMKTMWVIPTTTILSQNAKNESKQGLARGEMWLLTVTEATAEAATSEFSEAQAPTN